MKNGRNEQVNLHVKQLK